VIVALFAIDFDGHEYWATALFAVAMATDWVDGWLARRSGSSSAMGSLLDPVADKILVLSVLIVLLGEGVFAGWVVAAIVAREFLVSGLRLAALERGVVLGARDLGKLKTWTQSIAAILGGFAAAGAIDESIAGWALLVALVVTWVSGLDARGSPTASRSPPGRQTERHQRPAILMRLLPPGERSVRGEQGPRSSSSAAPAKRSRACLKPKGTRRSDDTKHVRQPIAAIVWRALPRWPTAVLAAKQSWAHREIKVVTDRGLMGGNAAAFRPDAPLTQRALADLVAGLTELPSLEPAAPAAQATLAGLDQALVRGLGLSDDARRFYLGARATGVKPPARFGSEVVARLIGLRKNHEARFDALELRLRTSQPRRGSVPAAQILRFSGWSRVRRRGRSGFELPAYSRGSGGSSRPRST
jgi:CDP-diacylglycerol--glycerol-3-phosphate 3-phosphatidyltransferase